MSRGGDPDDDDVLGMKQLVQSLLDENARPVWHLSQSSYRLACSQLRARPRRNLLAGLTPRRARSLLSSPILPSHLITSNARSTTFAFPSLHHITGALRLVGHHSGRCLIILPVWPAAPWWRLASQLAVSTPTLLPNFSCSPSKQISPSTASWAWIGLMCSGSASRRTRWRRNSSWEDLNQQLSDTITAVGGTHPKPTLSKTATSLRMFVERSLSAKH
mmetsp:Transcript_1878/g.3676  ORF Transcript_1878/g.3676 Transcript_1878/m.3676 type:complete len:218 (+) Transcript_1878:433-1086(+)